MTFLAFVAVALLVTAPLCWLADRASVLTWLIPLTAAEREDAERMTAARDVAVAAAEASWAEVARRAGGWR